MTLVMNPDGTWELLTANKMYRDYNHFTITRNNV